MTAIRKMYRNTKAKVLSPDGETRNFGIQAGFLQGDTLVLYLFVIVLDYVLKKAITNSEAKFWFILLKRQSKRIKPSVLTDCDFADDIVLMSNEVNQAHKFFNELEKVAKKLGLHINGEKNKFLSLNQKEVLKITTAESNNTECVDDYKYLRSRIGSTEKDVGIRKA